MRSKKQKWRKAGYRSWSGSRVRAGAGTGSWSGSWSRAGSWSK